MRLEAYDVSKAKLITINQELELSSKEETELTTKVKQLTKIVLKPKQELALLKISEEQRTIVTAKPELKKSVNLSASAIHYQLTAKLNLLTAELLPKIIGKKVTNQPDCFKCGSLHLSKEQGREGLWHRFSTGEGGNLFDLIKQAENFPDIAQAIVYAKNWLGMEHYQSNDSHKPLKSKTKEDLQAFKVVPTTFHPLTPNVICILNLKILIIN